MNASNEEKVMKNIEFKTGDFVVVEGMSDQERKEVKEFLESVGAEFKHQESRIKGNICEYYLSSGFWYRSSKEFPFSGGTNRTKEVLSSMKASKESKEYKYRLQFANTNTYFFIKEETGDTFRVGEKFFLESDLPEYIVEQTIKPIHPVVNQKILDRIQALEKEPAQLKSSL